MPQTATQITKKQAPARRHVSEKPYKELTRTQEELADLASQVILNGGVQADVLPLLAALHRHQYRNITFCGRGRQLTAAALEEEIRSRGARVAEQSFQDLIRNWPAPVNEPVDGEAAPKTVKKIAQADLRNRLHQQFNDFVKNHADLESIWLLNEILEWYVSDSIDLAEAFARMINTDRTYISVPWSQADKVRAFVTLIDDKEAE